MGYTNHYINDAIRTESDNFFLEADTDEARLLHASMGLCTEAAEFQDALKKVIFYGKSLDKVNLKEELGDMLWYMAIAMDALNTDFESEMIRNIEKLRVRYPDKFNDSDAENRDTEAERKVLEG